MSTDDITEELVDKKAKTTQPMIADVFNLVEELKRSVEKRFDATDKRLDEIENRFDATDKRFDATDKRLDEIESRARLDTAGINARLVEIESRAARDYAALDARLTEFSDEMKNGFLKLADMIEHEKLHREADYHSLLRKIRELESKPS